ncbi:MAG: glycosyltransferase family 4 protein [Planctomycetota bacterium]|nr:glycosyltransferase family 4 protein [Planctomycetota bacterium]
MHVMEATIGGTRRHITEATRGLLREGVDVYLVVSAERQPDFRDDLADLERAGACVLELPMVREVRPGLDIRHARALVRHVREVRPDIVHAHSSKGGVLGRWASLRTGIGRRIYSPHTFAFLHSARFGRLRRRLYYSVERWFGQRTDRIVAVSATEAETIRSSGVIDPDRVRVVPNGIDVAPYADLVPADLTPFGVPAGAPVAAVVGLVYEAKGQDLAVEVLARPGCEDLHLLIAGEGECRADFERLARERGVADRAHFLGWRKDVPSLLAASDFLLMPSRWEGMPYITMEALAARVPVVASRVDGVRELVRDGETGYTADVGSAASLAAACERMLALEPEERRAMGARGLDLVRASHGLDAMVRGLLEVYEELI